MQVKCHREFHGSEYGGWWVCPDRLSERNIVYSFGVGEDISFDLSRIRRFGLRVFAFDPTPRVIEWIAHQALPNEFMFVAYGLAGADGARRFFPPANPTDVSHSMVRVAKWNRDRSRSKDGSCRASLPPSETRGSIR